MSLEMESMNSSCRLEFADSEDSLVATLCKVCVVLFVSAAILSRCCYRDETKLISDEKYAVQYVANHKLNIALFITLIEIFYIHMFNHNSLIHLV